jgi:hypothetical protein
MSLKLYEEFIKSDELKDLIKQLETRARHWFSNGDLGKETNLNSIEKSEFTNRSYKSIIVNFNNENYVYQIILTVDLETPDKCKFEMKRYDIENTNLIDKIDEEVDIDEIKEDFIVNKISEFEEKSENPDENKIEPKKEDEEEPPQGQEEMGGEEGGGEFKLGGPGGEEGGQAQGGFNPDVFGQEEEFEF